MGSLEAGDGVVLMVAVAVVAVCAWVGGESVRRLLGHRFDRSAALLGTEEQEEVLALRRGVLERRYSLVEAAWGGVRGGARPGAPVPGGARTAADGDLPDPVAVVAALDRDLAHLDAEEARRVEMVSAAFTGRRERSDRARASALRLDVACAGAAVLLAGVAVGGAVAVLL
ncbi:MULTISPECIES: hypothetical protein [Nocardiopsidaceae]|uniref:Uncharacterized protein n=1 Tax=Streptomonospora nanhaiensis TaxID=1323731 RepID=A0ABY6YNU2_9ACTN|nr:hypothetical protein [Streptomonospora nanhaiensis]WAE73920.1 hypothetical protein OUQ99_01975 [Streptomonospora nanhaiensis]